MRYLEKIHRWNHWVIIVELVFFCLIDIFGDALPIAQIDFCIHAKHILKAISLHIARIDLLLL